MEQGHKASLTSRRSVLQILLKNMCSVVVGGGGGGGIDLHMQIRCILSTRVSVLEDQRTVCDWLQAAQWISMDSRYTRLYYTARANPASEWRDLATLARGMHVCKSLISYP